MRVLIMRVVMTMVPRMSPRMSVDMLLSVSLLNDFSLQRQNIHFRRVDAAAIRSSKLKPRLEPNRCNRFFQHRKRHSRIHKSAKKHVATDSGKTVEVTDLHRASS